MSSESFGFTLEDWLPTDAQVTDKIVQEVAKRTKARFEEANTQLSPSVNGWLEFIDQDPQAMMYFTRMMTPKLAQLGIKTYEQLLQNIDTLITSPPGFSSEKGWVVGVPILLLLTYMNTPDGVAVFLYEPNNKHIKAVLDAWKKTLESPDSTSVLHTGKDGWLGEAALKKFRESDGRAFEEMYKCDKSKSAWGFKSWDEFFSRPLLRNPNPRPIDTENTHVVSPCESAVLRIQDKVKRTDEFWLKKDPPFDSQPYSLIHMLGSDCQYIDDFVGGTVFQAYLSPFNYHRWHSPVSGIIKKIVKIPGAYFAPAPDTTRGLINSQPWLTATAARAVIYINSIEPAIGLIAFMPIGMGEVSTIDIRANENQKVNKGDELGTFRFGGSSQAIIFNKHTSLRWLDGIVDDQGKPVPGKMTPVNSGIVEAKRMQTATMLASE